MRTPFTHDEQRFDAGRFRALGPRRRQQLPLGDAAMEAVRRPLEPRGLP